MSTPTYSVDLSNGLKKLLATKKYGLYHLSNEGIASRLEFAKKAFDLFQVNNVQIIPVPLSKFQRASKPPLFSPLKNKRAKKLGIILPHWEESLVRFLKEHKFDN